MKVAASRLVGRWVCRLLFELWVEHAGKVEFYFVAITPPVVVNALLESVQTYARRSEGLRV